MCCTRGSGCAPVRKYVAALSDYGVEAASSLRLISIFLRLAQSGWKGDVIPSKYIESVNLSQGRVVGLDWHVHGAWFTRGLGCASRS